jgi:hypothetical protein
MEDLFKALEMFNQEQQKVATKYAIDDATQQMQQINTEITDKAQQRVAQQQLGNQLALKLVGAGADASKIQAAFQAVTPQNFGSVEQMQLEGQLSGNQQYNQVAGNILADRERKARSMETFKTDEQIRLERVKGELDIEKARVQSKNKLKNFNIPDFDLKEGFAPTEKDMELLKNANSDMKQIDSALSELDQLVNEHGTESFSVKGGVSKRMAILKQMIVGRMKDQQGLGALAGPDIDFLEKMLPDATSMFTTGSTYKEASDTFKKELYNAVSAKAESRGFDYKSVPKSMESLVQTRTLRDGRRVRVIETTPGKFKIVGR